MRHVRFVMVFGAFATSAPVVQAAEAPGVADQPGASSSLLDRLFPTSHQVPPHRVVANRTRPHDTAGWVVRVARADGHETASAGVPRARAGDIERLAVLDHPGSCDTIMCPGFAIIGVGF